MTETLAPRMTSVIAKVFASEPNSAVMTANVIRWPVVVKTAVFTPHPTKAHSATMETHALWMTSVMTENVLGYQ